MEALIFTRKYGSPWIRTACPTCKTPLHKQHTDGRTIKYCCMCGQKIEFNNLERVMNNQELNTNDSNEFKLLTFM